MSKLFAFVALIGTLIAPSILFAQKIKKVNGLSYVEKSLWIQGLQGTDKEQESLASTQQRPKDFPEELYHALKKIYPDAVN